MATRSAMDFRVRFSGRSPHFIKVFFPHTSSQRLKIPPKFGRGIDGDDFSAMVSLKGPSGRYWLITLTKNSNVCFFDDGWNEFVADHSLEFGDIMVFRYLGESRFRVIVFDSTACEKDKAFTARNGNVRVSLKRKMGSDGGVVSEGPLRKKRSATVTKKHRCCFHNCSITRRRVNPGSRTVEDGLNPQSTVRHSSSNPSKPCRGRPRKAIQIKGEPSLFNTPKVEPATSNRPMKTINKDKLFKSPKEEPTTSNRRTKTGNRANLFKTPKGEPITSNRRARTVNNAKLKTWSGRGGAKEQNKDRAHEKSKSFKSRHPFFKKVMTNFYAQSGFSLSAPRSFSKKYFPVGRTPMTLLDQDGKLWEVKYNSHGRYGAFSGGWRKFTSYHHLKVGDICIFELINKYRLRVHFFRVVG